MSRPADHSHSIRTVVLPSGKTIEVVYFDEPPVGVAAGPAAPVPSIKPHDTESGLHRCGSCDAELVYPLDWSEAGARHWQVTLRCPNCEWVGTGVFSSEAVERFDAELDRGTESIIGDLRRLMHVNMEAEIERFAAALHAEHIVADDF